MPLDAIISDDVFDEAQWVADSTVMRALSRMARRIAPRRSTVLITGETGCGKEMLARQVHAHSERAKEPFIPVDCTTLSDSLFESELFGHARGAFTGAQHETLGFIRCGDGGTVFLDEIGELPLSMQSKLLRVLQERTVTPVGSTRRHAVNVRFVAATNRNLWDMVERGAFRADLYYRLNVVSLHVPPLRRRVEDIVPLAEHFIAQQAMLYEEPACRLSEEAADALRGWRWPGNVRELSNIIEQAHVLCSGRAIEMDDLPPYFQPKTINVSAADPITLKLDDIERRTITEALRRTGHCKAAAGRLLGINIQRLNRRIRHLEICVR